MHWSCSIKKGTRYCFCSMRFKLLDSAEIACLIFFVLCHEQICAHTCKNAEMYMHTCALECMHTHRDGNLEQSLQHSNNCTNLVSSVDFITLLIL